jgi:hypothetical protein
MSAARSELLRLARDQGWRIQRTRGGHLRFSHELASHDVIAPSTPSCSRAFANARAELRRALPKSVPVPDKPPPKKKKQAKPQLRVSNKLVGRAREHGTRRIIGQAGGVTVELVLREDDAGRSWTVFLSGNCGIVDEHSAG